MAFSYDMIGHLVLAVILSSPVVFGSEYCDEFGSLFFDELKCISASTINDGCPSHYDCDSVKSGVCRFNGTTYEPGEVMQEVIGRSPCAENCQCMESGKMLCDKMKCKEDLGYKPRKGCYLKHLDNVCCAVEEVCPLLKHMDVCNVNGIKYWDGQRFTPQGTCLDCICTKGAGSICRRKTCGFELDHREAILKKCAPLYVLKKEEMPCCPNKFVCPSAWDVVVPIDERPLVEGECLFGMGFLKTNQELVTSIDYLGATVDVQCRCITPPFAMCIAKK